MCYPALCPHPPLLQAQSQTNIARIGTFSWGNTCQHCREDVYSNGFLSIPPPSCALTLADMVAAA